MCQKPKESVQQFLLRIMDARNKVVFDSKEADTDFNYGSQLIQNTFLKALETGIRDEYLTTSLRPILRKDGVSDEELMRSINELASQKTERENKLGLTERLSAKNAKVSSVEGAKGKKGTSPEASEKQDLLAEIKGIKSELSSLKAKVEEQVSKSNAPFQPRYPRGCPKCRRENNGNYLQTLFYLLSGWTFSQSLPTKEGGKRTGAISEGQKMAKNIEQTFPQCAFCKKLQVHGTIPCCKQFKAVYYCDRECQRKHWHDHKATCVALQSINHKDMKDNADLEFFATHLTPSQQNKLVQIIGRKCIVLRKLDNK